VHLSWVYYKEICYDAGSHERKKNTNILSLLVFVFISNVLSFFIE